MTEPPRAPISDRVERDVTAAGLILQADGNLGAYIAEVVNSLAQAVHLLELLVRYGTDAVEAPGD